MDVRANKGKISSAEINLERQSDKGNTFEKAWRWFKPNTGKRFYSPKSGGIVIGGVHTHPVAGLMINGELYSDKPSEQTKDISNFTNVNLPFTFPEFTIDSKYIDMTIPNKIAGNYPSFIDNFISVSSNNQRNIGMNALESNGKKEAPSTTKP